MRQDRMLITLVHGASQQSSLFRRNEWQLGKHRQPCLSTIICSAAVFNESHTSSRGLPAAVPGPVWRGTACLLPAFRAAHLSVPPHSLDYFMIKNTLITKVAIRCLNRGVHIIGDYSWFTDFEGPVTNFLPLETNGCLSHPDELFAQNDRINGTVSQTIDYWKQTAHYLTSRGNATPQAVKRVAGQTQAAYSKRTHETGTEQMKRNTNFLAIKREALTTRTLQKHVPNPVPAHPPPNLRECKAGKKMTFPASALTRWAGSTCAVMKRRTWRSTSRPFSLWGNRGWSAGSSSPPRGQRALLKDGRTQRVS